MNRTHNITIRLGNKYSLALKAVTQQEEEVVRQAERGVNDLWRTWCQRFPGKNPEEVMAMVAYRFAEMYYTDIGNINKGLTEISNAENRLDEILLAMGKTHSPEL